MSQQLCTCSTVHCSLPLLSMVTVHTVRWSLFTVEREPRHSATRESRCAVRSPVRRVCAAARVLRDHKQRLPSRVASQSRGHSARPTRRRRIQHAVRLQGMRTDAHEEGFATLHILVCTFVSFVSQ